MKDAVNEIDQLFIHLSWRCWNTLGVAGEGASHQDCFIDLEILILLTVALGKADPRLLEEALDWCSKFHHFVSVSRLRTLIEEIGESIYQPFSMFAETLNSIAKSKWPIFANVALLRMKPKGKSKAPDCKIPALLSLRLRALFGVGAKADLMTFILTEPSKPFAAADVVEIGYNKRTLADALDSFAKAGVLSCSIVRNQKQYNLSEKEKLISLVGELPKLIPDWRNLIMVFTQLRNVFLECQHLSISSKVVAIHRAATSLKNPLQKLGVSLPLLSSDPVHWESFIQQVMEMLKGLTNEDSYRKTMTISDRFEINISSIIQYLYKVDDYVDGLEFIISCSSEDPAKYHEVFKECYQMSACYLEELQLNLQDLLKFPIHLFMDFRISDITYKFSQEDAPSFFSFVKKIASSKEVTASDIKSNWRKELENELNIIHRFVHQIKERLKDLFSHRMNVHLLIQSTKLYKRHAVLRLFSAL